MKIFTIFVLSLCLLLVACATPQEGAAGNGTSTGARYSDLAYAQDSGAVVPGAIVYKTRADYDSLIPVDLYPDKIRISSSPDPTDLIFSSAGALRTPSPLHQGYLLDNKGISLNTAFVNISYVEYAKLDQSPSPEELFRMVVDADPFVEMYECGRIRGFMSQEEAIAKLNAMIDDGKLAELCKRLK